jgi:tetratricopeptide (TPR) repeat protein
MVCLGVLTLALTGLVSSRTSAQEPVLLEMYGQGVHAYFGGDLNRAFQNLSAAVQGGSRDPRVYYYRGLTYQRLGDSARADADFRQAAELETADADHYFDVGRALERIQGSQRMTLERYRSQARIAAVRRTQEIRRQRYEQLRQAEPEVAIPVHPRPAIPADELPDEESEMEMPLEESQPSEPETEASAPEPKAANPIDEPADMPAEEAPPAPETPREELPDSEPVDPFSLPESPPESAPPAPEAAPPEIDLPDAGPPADSPTNEEPPAPPKAPSEGEPTDLPE